MAGSRAAQGITSEQKLQLVLQSAFLYTAAQSLRRHFDSRRHARNGILTQMDGECTSVGVFHN
jgi:hypothetical protein